MKMILMLIVAPVLLAGVPVEDVTIVTIEDRKILASGVEIADVGGLLTLTYTDRNGKKQKIRCDEIAEIQVGKAKASASKNQTMAEVELSSGDRFIGRLGKEVADKVNIRTGLLGQLEIPFEKVRVIRSIKNRAHIQDPPTKRDQDYIYSVTGEQGKGTVTAVTNKYVEYWSDQLEDTRQRPLSRFTVAYLSATGKAPAPPKTLYAVALSTQQGRLAGEIQTLTAGMLTIKDLYGKEQKVALAKIASIYFKNGRVTQLPDMEDPKAEENANYIRGPKPLPSDLVIPWQRNRNAKGEALVMGGKTYRMGIGVHAYSSLEWNIKDLGYKRFHATIGLDDCGKGIGHVVFRVLLDGKHKYERAMDATDAAIDITVDVKGAETITLVADFGKRANQGDYANWASARLIR